MVSSVCRAWELLRRCCSLALSFLCWFWLSAFVISHVSQPSADMKFGTVPESLSVFDGETESNGRCSGLVDTVVVELGSLSFGDILCEGSL